MKGIALIASIIILAGGFIIACSDGNHGNGPTEIVPADVPSCGPTMPFSVLPVAASNIMGWVPLGAMNPPGHTFPTDHQYIYLTNFSSGNPPVPLYAPGNITVTGARVVHYNQSSAADDYALDFTPCRELTVDFGHVRTLSPALLAALGAFDQQCQTYSPVPGTVVNNCYTKPVDIKISAGEVIGTTAGLDLQLFDNRVTPIVYANPARWIQNPSGFDHFHVAPFSDYFAEPARTTVRSLLGSFDGKTHRTVEPLGGSLASDAIGTAQGSWLNPSRPTYPEPPHLAITPDNVDPSRIDVSIGTSQNGFTPGAYYFVPSASGTINRHPSAIAPGPTIYCWEIGYAPTDRRGLVLVQLTDVNTLQLETRATSTKTCAGEGTLAFSTAVVTYKR